MYNRKNTRTIEEYDEEIPEDKDYQYSEYEKLAKELVNKLDEDEKKRMFVDKFYNNMTIRELENKYNVPRMTIARIINKILKNIGDKIKKFDKI